jgi:hypothetical protein
MLPQEEKKEVPKIVYYFYKNSLLFLQAETPKIHPSNLQPTLLVSKKVSFFSIILKYFVHTVQC